MQFAGTERYLIKRRLGQGGMGVVYEAYDQQRQLSVALKTLSRVDAKGIYRLKQEFRSLADVVHPNLVALYDLGSSGNDWFFSMELVDGQDFVTYVRGAPESDDAPLVPPWAIASEDLPARGDGTACVRVEPQVDPTFRAPRARQAPALERLEPTLRVARSNPPRNPSFDVTRLRLCLAQLAEAVRAIHAAGKLHRDLKPNNVLVTPNARVVVLDFGLVQPQPGASEEVSLEECAVAGTPAYMAPEQATGERVTAACDWYAVGAMLYVALTGRLPFRGGVREILVAKQCAEPVPPSQLVAGVPADLGALCQALLRTDPARRPTTEDVLRRLQRSATPSVRSSALAPASTVPSYGPFYGREAELSVLEQSLSRTRSGRPLVVYVQGEAGSGKTALVERFVETQRMSGKAVVLRGRCYQREFVPFKAFDMVIDGLSRQLGRLPPERAEALLPRNLQDLLRVFPVLGRVDALVRAPRCGRADAEGAEDAELRTRGFAGLKELLARVADREPLVVWVDDLQWGDLDSAELLLRMLSPPDPPALLFVGCYREAPADPGPMLTRLGQAGPYAGGAAPRCVRLGALEFDSAMALAVDLLGDCGEGGWELAQRIVRETGSNPLLVTELSRYFGGAARPGNDAAARNDTASAALSLDRALEALLVGLTDEDRRLLDVLAVAGAPLRQRIAARASSLGGDVRLVVGALAARGLVRATQRQGSDAVELAHERLRDRLLETLDAERRAQYHLKLARELEASGEGDPEAVARHFSGGGDSRLAAEYALQAGERAFSSMAFERATSLFRLARKWGGPEGPDRWKLLARVGDSLNGAGRPAEAARELVAAAAVAPAEVALSLTRRAAELQIRHVQVEALFEAGPVGRYTLFDGIERAEVQDLIAQSEVVQGAAGERLVRSGEPASTFLVLLSGRAEIRQEEAVIATVGEGTVLGEMAFLLRSQRIVDVYAGAEPVRMLALSQESLAALAAERPELALKLVLNLSRILCAKLTSLQRRVSGIELSGMPGSSDA